MANKLPPGFSYALGRDKGVLTNVFESAFDTSKKTKKLESFQTAQDNKVTRSFDKITDAPEKAFRSGALFELKSPFGKAERDEFTREELLLTNEVDVRNEGEVSFDDSSDPTPFEVPRGARE